MTGKLGLGVVSLAAGLASQLLVTEARAQSPEPVPPAASEPTPAQKKAVYSLPFVMRPMAPPDVVRIDFPYAAQDAQTTIPMALTAGAKVLPDLGIYGKIALVHNAPDVGDSATVFSNPLLFALYSPQIAPKLRLPVFAGVALPIGAGGGDNPDKASRAAVSSGVYARQAMDNALFATNYLTPTVGIGLGWVDHGVTLQVEAQLLQLFRVRGSAVDSDTTRTNFTSGFTVGYSIVRIVNVNAELHYQRWLSTPVPVQKDSAYRDQFTAGGGVRVNVPLNDNILARPGIGYFQGLDAPMTTLGYHIVMLDVPVLF